MPRLVLDRLDRPVAGVEQAAPRFTPQLLAEILDVLPAPVFVKDRSHRWVTVNAAFCEHMGRARADMLGKTESDFLSAPAANAAWENDEAVFTSGRRQVVNEVVAADSEAVPRLLQTQKSLVRDADHAELLIGVVRDLTGTETELALLGGNSEAAQGPSGNRNGKSESRREYPPQFAISDPLTRLLNRRAFMNLLDEVSARVSHSAAIFLINIDHFKLVNDHFGHSAGDSVILEVASRLRSAIRPSDILGRLDSDEFVVLADGVDAMHANEIADQILAEIARPLKLSKHEYRMSVSVGIAMLPDHGLGAQELLRNAGTAMTWRKHRGRGGSEFYSHGARSAAYRKMTIQCRLPIALERGELSVHYQPIVRGSDGAVSGFEALARWHDAELGELVPTEFIPIAEEMGIIGRLGETIFDSACGFAASLTDPEITVSINISGSQLMDETFPIFVAESLQEHAVPGDRLFLEITESVAMDTDESVQRVFEELSSLGIRLIIDDFGTGFSNLARLKQLSFAAIKIDRGFIRDLPDSPQDRAIFRAAQAIAREMNLKTVAEGIENAEQDQFARALGADFLQGFRFGHPVPPEKLECYAGSRQER